MNIQIKDSRLFFGFTMFSILISISTNCKNGSTSVPAPQKENQILKGQKFELSGTFSAIDLEIADSMMIILCYGDQYKFHVYNKNTLKFVGQFGQEGRGPSEYMLPHIMSQKLKIKDSAYLVIYDNVLRRTNFVNILRALNNVNYRPKSINSRNRKIVQLSLIRSGVISGDSIFIGASGDNYIEGRFFCYDILKDNLTWEPYFPIPKIEPIEAAKDELYTSYLALRPNAVDIAAVSLFFRRIDILDKNGKLKRSIVLNQDSEPDFSTVSSLSYKGLHEYFASVSVSQDFIYALDIDVVEGSHEIVDTVFLVKIPWDEVGKPPEISKLTPRVTKMEVDEGSKKLFGLVPFNSFIYVYKMGN
jgi:hypothetical protein